MKLNSKRVAAALVTLAAFTGVLIKDIPFTSRATLAAEPVLPDNGLGDVGLLSTKEEVGRPAEKPQSQGQQGPVAFRSENPGPAATFTVEPLTDNPSGSRRSQLPNPVGSSAANEQGRDVSPFFAISPSSSGSGGTGSVGGGGGGAGGGGSPGTGGGAGPGPVVNGPGGTDNNPPADHGGPENPATPGSNNGPKDDHGNPPAGGDEIEIPSVHGPTPDPTITPPPFNEPLPETPGQFPDPQTPVVPNPDSHSVPDGGSTALLTLLAVVALAVVRRK